MSTLLIASLCSSPSHSNYNVAKQQTPFLFPFPFPNYTLGFFFSKNITFLA